MTQQGGASAAGRAIAVPDGNEITASSITAQATVSEVTAGRYHNLDADEARVSPDQDSVVMASVPPGDSFNSSHYATSAGEPVSESESELLAAAVRFSGEISSSVSAEMEVRGPGGKELFTTDLRIESPPDGYAYEQWGFWGWVGRDFSQEGNTEVVDTGTHTFDFFTGTGNATGTINVTGPEVISCDTPFEITKGKTEQASVTVSNASNSSFGGDVVWARDEDRRDEIARETLNIGPQSTETVTTTISSSTIAPSTDVVAYCMV